MLPPSPDVPPQPVEPSGFAPTLAGSSPRYVSTLRDGAVFVLVAMVVNLVAGLVAIGGGFIVAMAAPATGELSSESLAAIEMTHALLTLVAGAAGVIGWWWLTTRDPQEDSHGAVSGSRPLVRTTVLAQSAALLALAAAPMLLAPGALGSEPGGAMAIVGVLGLVALVAMVVKFFASMTYLRWLAPRLPDETIEEGAARFMWLGPLLVTLGSLIIVGPLIAVIMYWNLIFKTWNGLREISAKHRDEAELLAAARRDHNIAA